MRLLAVAMKDMRQSYRSLAGIMFMFVIPLLVTGLFYVMFGGFGGDEEGFVMPRTSLLIVNLDEGELPANSAVDGAFVSAEGVDLSQVNSLGDLVVQILSGEAFSDLVTVSQAHDLATARRAVDDQEANVAIIIPANFTSALMTPEETAALELYQDPTLTLGPAVVESIIEQFADRFAATKIGTNVVLGELAAAGVVIDGEMVDNVIGRFTLESFGQTEASPTVVNVRLASGDAQDGGILAEILGQILSGMMAFFAFFTGATMLQTILVEEEKGTLARLFTTPTPIGDILGGKVLAAILTLVVQVIVLMSFGAFVFRINWGALLPVSLAAVGIVLLSAATGLFIVSWLKSTRQAGIVYGGVLTLTGMIGMISTFGGVEVTPAVLTVSLLVPQGWAVRGLQLARQGGTLGDMLPTFAGLMAWVVVFVSVGRHRLQKRFA